MNLRLRGRILVAVATVSLLATPRAGAQALPKPEVGPEKPFAPPARVERTLANGLRVICLLYTSDAADE